MDSEWWGFERELSRGRVASGHVEEMERQKCLLVEAFGTYLKPEIRWVPP